jgi:hypothetical protein
MQRKGVAVSLRALVVALAAALPALAQDKQNAPDKVDQAVARALKYFVAAQNPAEGWISDTGANRTAMTSLAILALAATGHQPGDDTAEGQCMKKALTFVLKAENQDPQGFLGGRDGSRMYGHGIVTLMLSEMVGMGVDAQMDQLLRERCKKAVDLVLRSQALPKDARNAGGWRYMPDSRDSDLSATVWQLMALRSAKNAGFDVPKEAITKAVEYVKRCYKAKRDAAGKPDLSQKSACAYEPGQNPEYAMAAAGLLSLQVCGEYECPEVVGSADWTYYYAHGMFQRGGDYATHARKLVEEILLPKQNPDGSWQGQHGQERGSGKVYCTAMGVLSLAVKYHFLPIYQR